METEKFPVPMRLMHWLMAVIILGLIGSGWFMAGLDPEVAPYKYDIYFWHKSFGVLALLLIVVRIVVLLASTIPELPAGLPEYEKKLAHAAHRLLYLFMFFVPLSGLLMSDLGGHAIPFFGLILPDMFETNKELAGTLHTIHVNIPYAMLAIIALHILAALKHRFMDSPENDVLKKML